VDQRGLAQLVRPHRRLPGQLTFSKDFMLTILTLYWAISTITASMRDYYDNRRQQRLAPLAPPAANRARRVPEHVRF
jgi:hypothetical protein